MKTIHLEFFFDLICPWCFIGLNRLLRIEQELLQELYLDIELKSYLLYPEIPIEGVPKEAFAKKTKPGMAKSLKFEAEEEGISINYRLIKKIPRSIEPHRLFQLIKNKKLKINMANEIMRSYFTDGTNIGNQDELIQSAQNIGIDQSVIEEFLSTENGQGQIEIDRKFAKENFISQMPSINIDQKIIMPGLQSADTWKSYLRRAKDLKQSN